MGLTSEDFKQRIQLALRDTMDEFKTDFERAERLQNLLISVATGGEAKDRDYKELRLYFVQDPTSGNIVPSWLRTCRDLGQFWSFIKSKFGHYAERREFIWNELGPLLAFLENGKVPAESAITDKLKDFSAGGVQNLWYKALEGKTTDLEGAITLAKSLLEAVLKPILDERSIGYFPRSRPPETLPACGKGIESCPCAGSA